MDILSGWKVSFYFKPPPLFSGITAFRLWANTKNTFKFHDLMAKFTFLWSLIKSVQDYVIMFSPSLSRRIQHVFESGRSVAFGFLMSSEIKV